MTIIEKIKGIFDSFKKGTSGKETFPNVVSVQWLKEHIDSVQIIDASWHMPSSNRSAQKEFENEHPPNARFFDLSECRNKDVDLPHTMPPAEKFQECVRDLGVTTEKPIVVYDSNGIFTSPRVWFMFKAFGISDVAILDGGLPAYKKAGLPLSGDPVSSARSSFTLPSSILKSGPTNLVTCDDVLAATSNKKVAIVDARSRDRFSGEADDPKPGIKGGAIPSSFNVPFTELVEKVDGISMFKNKAEQNQAVVSELGNLEYSKYFFSCGAGITACIDMLVFVESLGIPFSKCSLYDGSYTEWRLSDRNFPVVPPATN